MHKPFFIVHKPPWCHHWGEAMGGGRGKQRPHFYLIFHLLFLKRAPRCVSLWANVTDDASSPFSSGAGPVKRRRGRAGRSWGAWVEEARHRGQTGVQGLGLNCLGTCFGPSGDSTSPGSPGQRPLLPHALDGNQVKASVTGGERVRPARAGLLQGACEQCHQLGPQPGIIIFCPCLKILSDS